MPAFVPVILLGGPLCGLEVPWDESAIAMRVRADTAQIQRNEEYVRIAEQTAIWSQMPEAKEML